AEVTRRLYPDGGHETWQAELSALAQHIRRTLLAHPRWTPILSRPAPPMATAVRERVLKLMVESGIASGEALKALYAVISAGIGPVLVELTFREPDGAFAFARRFERTLNQFEQEPDSGTQPTSREAFAQMGHFDFEDMFRFSIDRLIGG